MAKYAGGARIHSFDSITQRFSAWQTAVCLDSERDGHWQTHPLCSYGNAQGLGGCGHRDGSEHVDPASSKRISLQEVIAGGGIHTVGCFGNVAAFSSTSSFKTARSINPSGQFTFIYK